MEARSPEATLDARLLPYVMATPAVLAALDLARAAEVDVAPLAGRRAMAIAREHRVDPMRTASSPFMDAVQRLDALLYGAQGLTAPRWALYDCAGLPGVVIGFGEHAGSMAPEARVRLGVPDAHEGLVPVSMMIAIPMLGVQRWLVYGLGSARGSADVGGLDARTLALGLEALHAREVTATVQWGSSELAAFAALAEVRVLAAWLPAHDLPATAVLRFHPGDARTAVQVGGPITLLDPADPEALRALQRDIEDGVTVTIAGPLTTDGDAPRVPVQRKGAP